MTLVHSVIGFAPLLSCKSEILACRELDFVLKADRGQRYRKAALKHFPKRLTKGGSMVWTHWGLCCSAGTPGTRSRWRSAVAIQYKKGCLVTKASNPLDKKEWSLVGRAKQRRTRQQEQQSGCHTRGIQPFPLCSFFNWCCYCMDSIGKTVFAVSILITLCVWTLENYEGAQFVFRIVWTAKLIYYYRRPFTYEIIWLVKGISMDCNVELSH